MGHGRNRHEQVGKDRLWEDEQRVVEAANDSRCDGSSSHHEEVENDDDNHRDEGCIHVREEVRDRSSHRLAGSHLDGMVVGTVSDSDRCVGSHLESENSEWET